MFEREPFDIVIADLYIKDRARLDFIAELRALDHPPEVIVVTGYPSIKTAIEALDLRVFAYLVKPFKIDELIRRIEQLRTREEVNLERSTQRLAADDANPSPAGLLSPREREVLHDLTEGYRVVTIAARLHISPHTVRRHLKNIFLKLEVNSQAELIEKLRPWRD